MKTTIQTTDNAHRGENMLLSFHMDTHFNGLNDKTTLTLRYIADRDIVTDENFQVWVQALTQHTWENTAQVAGEVIAQFYDQLLPSYVDIRLLHTNKNNIKHQAFLAKQQPNFKIPELIAPALNIT